MRKIWWSGLLTVSGLLFSLPAFSQQRWERNYGGPGNEGGWSVQQTSDGGYVIVGGNTFFGIRGPIYLIKTNAFGDTLWTRTYGGSGDMGYSVQQTQDGGYIVTGIYHSFGGNPQVYLIKTNPSGDTLWSRIYGGSAASGGYSVQQISDTGYIIAGSTSSLANNSDVYLIKTNASGDTLWTRNYGGVDYEYGYSVQQTTDGGYIVAGYTSSFGSVSQVYLIKTNFSGDTLWTKTYGGAREDWGYSVQQTTDGGYIVAGVTYSFGAGNSDVYLIKTNASGDTLWTKTFGGAEYDLAYSVQQTSDTGYIVTGGTNSFGYGYHDVYLIKTNAFGDTLWTRTYGGTLEDAGCSVQQTSDRGYIVAGITTSFGDSDQVYLIKTDANGNVGVEDNSPGRIKPLTSNFSFSVIPNPFTSFATVPGHSSERFALYDVSGRKVGIYKGDRIGEGLSAGVYFLRPDGKDSKPLRVVKVR